MEGGVPAGTNMRPGELGCLTTRMRINITTKLGKSSRNPKGIDMDEFPFNLTRLRKNDNLDMGFDFSSFKSSADGVEGKRLRTRCRNPMVWDGDPETSRPPRRTFALLLEDYLAIMQAFCRALDETIDGSGFGDGWSIGRSFVYSNRSLASQQTRRLEIGISGQASERNSTDGDG